MKSIMGLGHLPKKDPESCRAWLHGKLFTSLLVERMIGAAKTFSPWGYELDAAQEQMAGIGVHVPRSLRGNTARKRIGQDTLELAQDRKALGGIQAEPKTVLY
jgi:hypothetical protein